MFVAAHQICIWKKRGGKKRKKAGDAWAEDVYRGYSLSWMVRSNSYGAPGQNKKKAVGPPIFPHLSSSLYFMCNLSPSCSHKVQCTKWTMQKPHLHLLFQVAPILIKSKLDLRHFCLHMHLTNLIAIGLVFFCYMQIRVSLIWVQRVVEMHLKLFAKIPEEELLHFCGLVTTVLVLLANNYP